MATSSSPFLDEVEKEYGTRDLYSVLCVTKEAKDSEIKRAYYKLSLKVHPDRVELDEIETATRKFQILCKINDVLSDSEKRKVYDETGCILGEDEGVDIFQDINWIDVWKLMFKSVTVEDIKQFETKYKGSEEEKEELKSAYLDYEGDMDKILETVMCAELDDEDRFRQLITQWVNEGSLPSYPTFFENIDAKRKKRKRKRDKEALEVEAMSKELGLGNGSDSLKMLIKAKQQEREKATTSFFDKLEEKYCNTNTNSKKKKKTSNGASSSQKGKRKGRKK